MMFPERESLINDSGGIVAPKPRVSGSNSAVSTGVRIFGGLFLGWNRVVDVNRRGVSLKEHLVVVNAVCPITT